jgi:glycerophosphoryl diester phosphodiesterase
VDARAWGSLLVLAHRAGNDLACLRAAEDAGADVIEADVHLAGGRLEVRHLKGAGPLPLLWDRSPWQVRARRGPCLRLDEVLAAARPDTQLLLDLKGIDLRLGRLVSESIERHDAGSRVAVCSRFWPLVERVQAPGVRRVYSAGNRIQLARLRPRLRRVAPDGVSVRRSLLEAPLVRELRERVACVMTWPVAGPTDAERLRGWGVNGLICDDLALVRTARLEAA